MAKGIHKEEVGHGFDGSYRFTVGVILGLLMVIGGIGLIVYANTLIFGVPLLLLGLALPILLELILSGRND